MNAALVTKGWEKGGFVFPFSSDPEGRLCIRIKDVYLEFIVE